MPVLKKGEALMTKSEFYILLDRRKTAMTLPKEKLKPWKQELDKINRDICEELPVLLMQELDRETVGALVALLLYPDAAGAVRLLAEGVNTAQKDVVEAALHCFQEVLQKKKR